MMTGKPCAKWAGVVLAAAMTLAAGGCINIKLGEEPADEDKQLQAKKVDKDAAYRIARSAARDGGVNPDRYKLQDRKFEDSWWILFDQKGKLGYKSFPEHFAVRVWPDGRSKLYKGN